MERYHRIVRDMGGVIADHQVSGLHVHVGVARPRARRDRVERGATVDAAAHGAHGELTAVARHDTGYDSWRTVLLRRWTTAGSPPSFVDAADYDRRTRRLLGIGGTVDLGVIMWDIRLSEHLPTIEFRMGDAQLEAEPTHAGRRPVPCARDAFGATTQATDAAANASADVPPELLSAALLHSAHFGMRERIFDPDDRRTRSRRGRMAGLVPTARTGTDGFGDLEPVQDAAARLVRDGTGAERQRAAFRAEGMAGVRKLFDATIVADQPRSGEPTTSNR